jgi:hypothetical protein
MTTDIALFPPPPRRVRRKSWDSGCTVAFLRLFVLPHMIIGVLLLLSVPQHFYVWHFGTSVTATVDRLDTRPGKKGGTNYYLYFHYQLDGRRYDESDGTDADIYRSTHVGEQFPGVATAILGKSLFLSSAKSIGAETGVVLITALFWNGVVSIFAYLFWFVPLRQRWTVKYGEAAVGQIEGTSTRRARNGLWYYVTHRFTTPDNRTLTGKSRVSKDVYTSAVVGTPLIVLYNPRRPKWNLAYEYCDFVVAEPAMR